LTVIAGFIRYTPGSIVSVIEEATVTSPVKRTLDPPFFQVSEWATVPLTLMTFSLFPLRVLPVMSPGMLAPSKVKGSPVVPVTVLAPIVVVVVDELVAVTLIPSVPPSTTLPWMLTLPGSPAASLKWIAAPSFLMKWLLAISGPPPPFTQIPSRMLWEKVEFSIVGEAP
jgi:hypothetical protein